jgi:N-acetylmuramoyl-L-alanine amidase
MGLEFIRLKAMLWGARTQRARPNTGAWGSGWPANNTIASKQGGAEGTVIRVLALTLSLLCAASAQAAQVEVKGARLWSAPDQTRLVVDIAAPIRHKVFALTGPDRLVIDVADARLAGELPTAKHDDLVIAGLRSGVREGDDLRIVVDLKQPVRAKSFLLAPNETYGHRLVVDLEPKAAAGDGKAAAAVRSVTGAGGAVRDVIVAVDAGHGGEDPGAIGPAGTREKDVTLAIARKLAKRIDARTGMRAVMVRDGDYYVRLRQRIDKARKHRADLFVSIHADAFRDRRVRGSSVYTLSHGGATSEAARWLAERENRADLIGGVELREQNDILAKVLIDMSQNATMEHSGIAAAKVLANLQRLGNVHQTHIQKAGFAVLKSPDVPSMLVETAFISNPDEEKRLRSGSYQNRMADSILAGIVAYFEEYPPPETHFARRRGGDPGDGGRRHRIIPGDTLSEIARSYNVSLHSLRSANQLDSDRIRVGQVLVVPGDG